MNMVDFLLNFGSWIWVGILILCCIVEAATFSLTTIWGAIASIPLIFIARTHLGFQWQLLIFVAITLILVIFTRPFAIKKLKTGKEQTNVSAMIGEEVLVIKAITTFQKGEAKAKNGVIWTATAEDNKEISENTVAEIINISGNTLILKTKDNN